MKRNNLFAFATGELSQDAFLCWCANWANFKDTELYEMGRNFVQKISGVSKVQKVDIYRQYEKIDVLLIVNDTVAVIIEDKTFTSEHDNQIIRYIDIIEESMEDGMFKIKENEYNITEIKTVFLKTGNFYSHDEEIANSEFVDMVIRREDMIDFVKDFAKSSEIVNDYYLHLIKLDKEYKEIEKNYLEKNYNEALKEHWGQYYCIYDIFGSKKMIGEFLNKDIIISSGSSFGRPYTWAWLWGKDNWYWLGYKIDRDCQGYFISLRQYRDYKKSENRELILTQKKEMYDKMVTCLKKLTDNYKLKADIPASRSGYAESEMGRFYFHNNDINKLKDTLYNIAEKLILSCVAKEII